LRTARRWPKPLVSLMRGYEVLRKEFDRTHAKWLEADMAANLERTQRGEQFEVVDPAQVPDSPFRPDVKKALPMAIAAALALAVALSFRAQLHRYLLLFGGWWNAPPSFRY
jgi:succinoglycan biosynthesis transport protein ExoP